MKRYITEILLLFHLKFKESTISYQGSGINIRYTMYADSPYRVEYAYAAVRYPERLGRTNAD